MIIHIIKRDRRKVPFNIEKIANAIFKAAQSCGGSENSIGNLFNVERHFSTLKRLPMLFSKRLSHVAEVI